LQAGSSSELPVLPAHTDQYKNLLNELSKKGKKQEDRAVLMMALAEQLPRLSGEKTKAYKAKEIVVRSLAAAGRGGTAVLLHLPGVGPSQKQLKTHFRTPQAEAFHGLMDHLANPHRLTRSSAMRVAGFKIKTHRPEPTAFDYSDLERRSLNAPVWNEIILHANVLKDSRQNKMLDGFAANFEDLPVHGKESEIGVMSRMIDAYAESFSNLVAMLGQSGRDSRTDSLSKQETKVLDILDNFAVRLSEQGRQQLINNVRSTLAQLPSESALSSRLTGLERTLERSPSQIDVPQGKPAAIVLEGNTNADVKTLMRSIRKPTGTIEELATNMTLLAQQLPRVGEKQPNSFSSIVREIQQGSSSRKEAFDFLIHYLDTPKNRLALEKREFGSLSIPKRTVEFDRDDIVRRIHVAPVWTELLSHARILEPNDQKRLLKRLTENLHIFDSLTPEEAKTWAPEREKLLAAYVPSLVKLVEVFADLGSSRKPDSTSPNQSEAIKTLLTYGPRLAPDAQDALMEEIGKVAEAHTELVENGHPGMAMLTSLQQELRPSTL
jgi:hypothetical protein